MTPGGEIAGVPLDVVSPDLSVDGTYEQLSFTFTPTERGVVDVILKAWGGTDDYVWIDDMSAAQP